MSKEEKKPIEITLQALQALVNDGKTKGEIGTHFGLTPIQTAKLLKEAGLKPKRAIIPAFVLIKDSTVTPKVEEAREVGKTEVKKEKATKSKVTDDSDLLQITNKVETGSVSTTEDEW